MQDVPPPSSGNFRRVALVGYAVIASCVGMVGAWAALSKVSSAVIASASISLESRRQVVQHLEGGMISEIHAREGSRVEVGQLLFALDTTQTAANEKVLRAQLFLSRAQEARLEAERNANAFINFPKEILDLLNNRSNLKVVKDQVAQFLERRSSLNAQVALLKSRIISLRDEIKGLKGEVESVKRQLYFIDDELVGVRSLVKKELLPKTRQSSLEREKARLEGLIGRNIIDQSKAENSVNEVNLQIQQIKQKFQEDVVNQLVEIRQRVKDLVEKLTVAANFLQRSKIYAPKSGLVQSVKITTVGQVIKPGDVLLEIVPRNDQLLIEAQVQPVDVDKVHSGMVAEVRFPSFEARTAPLILGKVRSLSRDRLIDENTRQPYFLAQISISETDIPTELGKRLRAGMPAEVIIPTADRTVLEYMVHPLKEALRHSLREK